MGRPKGSKNKSTTVSAPKKETKKSNVEVIEADVEQEKEYDLVVNVSDTWRLVKIDEYQFQIQNYKLPKETHLHKDKERVPRWYGVGYYPSVAMALAKMYDKILLDKEGNYTLSEFMAIARDTKEAIMDAWQIKI